MNADSSGELSGVGAIVTGSTRGLGFAFARALLDQGAKVVINGRDEAACQAAAMELDPDGGSVRYVVGGIEVESTAAALVRQCQDAFGCVGFVVNNAGITRDRSLLRMSVDDFDAVVAVHLRGTWLMCRAAASAMKDTGGAILNLTSGSALYGLVGQSNYAAAKGGVTALTRALSVELERFGIRVNALYPVAATDMTTPLVDATGGVDSPFTDAFGDPAHVAKVVAALAGDRTSQITGQVIAFDGTELALWSHPEQLVRIAHGAPWSAAQIDAAMCAVADQRAPLHPDTIGSLTRSLMAQKPQPRPTRANPERKSQP
ncbi:hypothetical protein B1790_05405 [Mycobacterium sp. AT1]|nr:hypothetical protein B1790_05405 [Mycobacterium sp. AT1]